MQWGEFPWPQHSPDLSPLDQCFRGFDNAKAGTMTAIKTIVKEVAPNMPLHGDGLIRACLFAIQIKFDTLKNLNQSTAALHGNL